MKMEFNKIYPFWEKLSAEEQRLISDGCMVETFEKGMLMHRSDEECRGLMTVLSGEMRTYILSEEGREVTLFRVRSGEICVLSASCLMDSIDFDVLIEATEKTEVLILPSTVLNSLMKGNAAVELYLYKSATDKFSDVMWTIQQILFQKIDQRVATFLWDEMAHKELKEIALTHEEIARYIGSAREVVTRVLKYLASAGAIELKRGKICVIDKEKLKTFL